MKKLSLQMLNLQATNLLLKGEKRAIFGGERNNPCPKDSPIHCGCGICVGRPQECTVIIIPPDCFPVEVD